VLLKPGKLEPAEFEIIKQHPVTALSLLGPVAATGPQIDVANMVRLHHERPDGKGYVEGVTLEQLICPKLWVLPVADAFDAMTSKRVYRDDMPIEKALAIVRENAFQPASDGTQKGQFHPQLAAAFVELINEGLVVFCDDLTPKASAVATWARPAAETTSPEIHA
jgi:HD-GYP domain-containing protein (c-di-GMP phosphodiesterase class II)